MCQQNRTAESGLKYNCTHGAVDVEHMKALNVSVLSYKTRLTSLKSYTDADGFKTSATVINMLIMFTASFRTDDNGLGVWLCYKTQ